MNAIKPPEWMLSGLCAQTDPEAFFPEKGCSPEPAKRVCKACPVRARCLAYAIDHDMPYGVWGGKSTAERQAIAERQRQGVRAA